MTHVDHTVRHGDGNPEGESSSAIDRINARAEEGEAFRKYDEAVTIGLPLQHLAQREKAAYDEEQQKVFDKAKHYEGKSTAWELQSIGRGADQFHRKFGAIYGLWEDEATMQEFYRESDRVGEAFDMAMDMGDVSGIRKFANKGLKDITDMVLTAGVAGRVGTAVFGVRGAMAGIYTAYGADTLSREYHMSRAAGLSKADAWQTAGSMAAIEIGIMGAFHVAGKFVPGMGGSEARLAKTLRKLYSSSSAKDTASRLAAEALAKTARKEVESTVNMFLKRPLARALWEGGWETTEEILTGMGQVAVQAAMIPGAENAANWTDKNGSVWNSPMMGVMRHTFKDTVGALMFMYGPAPMKHGVRRFLHRPSRTNYKAIEVLLEAAGLDIGKGKSKLDRLEIQELLIQQLRAGKLGPEIEALSHQYGVDAESLMSGWGIDEDTSLPAEFGEKAYEVIPGVVLTKEGSAFFGGEYTAAQIEQAERAIVQLHNKLGADMGYKLRIVDGDFDEGSIDGIHIGADKTIWMTRQRVRHMIAANPTLTDAAIGLYMHEFTHSLENTGDYDALYSYVMKNFKGQLMQARRVYEEIAKRSGRDDYSQEELDKEGLATWMQDHLVSSGVLHKLAKENSTLFERVRNWVYRAADRWRGDSSYAKVFAKVREAARDNGIPPLAPSTPTPESSIPATDPFPTTDTASSSEVDAFDEGREADRESVREAYEQRKTEEEYQGDVDEMDARYAEIMSEKDGPSEDAIDEESALAASSTALNTVREDNPDGTVPDGPATQIDRPTDTGEMPADVDPVQIDPITGKLTSSKDQLRRYEDELEFLQERSLDDGAKRKLAAHIEKKIEKLKEAIAAEMEPEAEIEANYEEDRLSELEKLRALRDVIDVVAPTVQKAEEAHEKNSTIQAHPFGAVTGSEEFDQIMETLPAAIDLKTLGEANEAALMAQDRVNYADNMFGQDSEESKEAQKLQREYRAKADELSAKNDWEAFSEDLDFSDFFLDPDLMRRFFTGELREGDLESLNNVLDDPNFQAGWTRDRMEAAREAYEKVEVPAGIIDQVTDGGENATADVVVEEPELDLDFILRMQAEVQTVIDEAEDIVSTPVRSETSPYGWRTPADLGWDTDNLNIILEQGDGERLLQGIIKHEIVLKAAVADPEFLRDYILRLEGTLAPVPAEGVSEPDADTTTRITADNITEADTQDDAADKLVDFEEATEGVEPDPTMPSLESRERAEPTRTLAEFPGITAPPEVGLQQEVVEAKESVADKALRELALEIQTMEQQYNAFSESVQGDIDRYTGHLTVLSKDEAGQEALDKVALELAEILKGDFAVNAEDPKNLAMAIIKALARGKGDFSALVVETERREPGQAAARAEARATSKSVTNSPLGPVEARTVTRSGKEIFSVEALDLEGLNPREQQERLPVTPKHLSDKELKSETESRGLRYIPPPEEGSYEDAGEYDAAIKEARDGNWNRIRVSDETGASFGISLGEGESVDVKRGGKTVKATIVSGGVLDTKTGDVSPYFVETEGAKEELELFGPWLPPREVNTTVAGVPLEEAFLTVETLQKIGVGLVKNNLHDPAYAGKVADAIENSTPEVQEPVNEALAALDEVPGITVEDLNNLEAELDAEDDAAAEPAAAENDWSKEKKKRNKNKTGYNYGGMFIWDSHQTPNPKQAAEDFEDPDAYYAYLKARDEHFDGGDPKTHPRWVVTGSEVGEGTGVASGVEGRFDTLKDAQQFIREEHANLTKPAPNAVEAAQSALQEAASNPEMTREDAEKVRKIAEGLREALQGKAVEIRAEAEASVEDRNREVMLAQGFVEVEPGVFERPEFTAAQARKNVTTTPRKDLSTSERMTAGAIAEKYQKQREKVWRDFDSGDDPAGEKAALDEIDWMEKNEGKASSSLPKERRQYALRGLRTPQTRLLIECALFAKASLSKLDYESEIPEWMRQLSDYQGLRSDLEFIETELQRIGGEDKGVGMIEMLAEEVVEGVQSQETIDEVQAFCEIVMEDGTVAGRQRAKRVLAAIGGPKHKDAPPPRGDKLRLITQDLYAKKHALQKKIDNLKDQLAESPQSAKAIAKELVAEAAKQAGTVTHLVIRLKQQRQHQLDVVAEVEGFSEEASGRRSDFMMKISDAITARGEISTASPKTVAKLILDEILSGDLNGRQLSKFRVENSGAMSEALNLLFPDVKGKKGRDVGKLKLALHTGREQQELNIPAALKSLGFGETHKQMQFSTRRNLAEETERYRKLSARGHASFYNAEDLLDAERLGHANDMVEKFWATTERARREDEVKSAMDMLEEKGKEKILEEIRHAVETDRWGSLDVRYQHLAHVFRDEAADDAWSNPGDVEKLTRATDLAQMALGVAAAAGHVLNAVKRLTPLQRVKKSLAESFFSPPKRIMEKILKLRAEGDFEGAARVHREWTTAEATGKKKTLKGLITFLAGAGVDMSDPAKREVVMANPEEAMKVLHLIGQYNSTKGDKLFEYWRNSILSGPTTQAANVIGTIFFTAYEIALKRNLMATMNLALQDPNLPTFAENMEIIKAGAVSWMGNARDNSWSAFESEQHQLEHQLSEAGFNVKSRVGRFGAGGSTAIYGGSYTNPFTGKKTTVGRTVRLPQRMLLMVDERMKTSITEGYAAGFAYRAAQKQIRDGNLTKEQSPEFIAKLLNPENKADDIWMPAYQEALKQTWQQDLGKAGQLLVQMREAVPVLRFVMPFIVTPMNIFATGMKMSPLAWLPKVASWQQASKDESITGEKRIEELGADIANAILMGIPLAMVLGQDDDDPWVTGSESTVTQGREKYPSGREGDRPPYSIRIPGTDKWVSYSRIEPFATALGATVDAAKAIKSGVGGRWEEATGVGLEAVYGQLTEKTFIRGIGDIAKAARKSVQGDVVGGAGAYGSNFLASWVPNLVRAPARALQTSMPDRKVYGENEDKLRRLAEGTLKRTEVLSAMGVLEDMPKVDMWGREFPRHQSFGKGWEIGDFLYKVFVPIQIKTTHMFVGDQTMRRYNNSDFVDENPEKAYTGPEAPARYFEIKNKKHWMTPQQYDEMCRMSGTLAAELCRTLSLDVDNPTELDMKKIRQSHKAARAIAREALTEKWWGSGDESAVLAATAEGLRGDMIKAYSRILAQRTPATKSLTREERRLPYGERMARLEEKREEVRARKEYALEWLQSEGIGAGEAAQSQGTRRGLAASRREIRKSYRVGAY